MLCETFGGETVLEICCTVFDAFDDLGSCVTTICALSLLPASLTMIVASTRASVNVSPLRVDGKLRGRDGKTVFWSWDATLISFFLYDFKKIFKMKLDKFSQQLNFCSNKVTSFVFFEFFVLVNTTRKFLSIFYFLNFSQSVKRCKNDKISLVNSHKKIFTVIISLFSFVQPQAKILFCNFTKRMNEWCFSLCMRIREKNFLSNQQQSGRNSSKNKRSRSGNIHHIHEISGSIFSGWIPNTDTHSLSHDAKMPLSLSPFFSFPLSLFLSLWKIGMLLPAHTM